MAAVRWEQQQQHQFAAASSCGAEEVSTTPLLTFTVRIGFERTTLSIHHQENVRYPKALQKFSI
jgi:hypothetical protein